MDSSYEAFQSGLRDRVTLLKNLMCWKSVVRSPEVDSLVAQADKALRECEQWTQEMEKQLDEEQQWLSLCEKICTVTDGQLRLVDHICQTLPRAVPGSQGAREATAAVVLSASAAEKLPPPPTEAAAPAAAGEAPSAAAAAVPSYAIPYVTVSELDGVSAYMKGRLTVDKMNEAVDTIRSVLQKKYQLYQTPISKMTEEQLHLYKGFHQHENAATRAMVFFVESDLRLHSAAWKSDSTGRSILTVLRHLGRVTEAREGKIIRYVLPHGV